MLRVLRSKWLTQGPTVEAFEAALAGFPNALQFAASTLSIPMFPSLTDEEVEYVADTVQEICAQET